jgi:hypothetical protein
MSTCHCQRRRGLRGAIANAVLADDNVRGIVHGLGRREARGTLGAPAVAARISPYRPARKSAQLRTGGEQPLTASSSRRPRGAGIALCVAAALVLAALIYVLARLTVFSGQVGYADLMRQPDDPTHAGIAVELRGQVAQVLYQGDDGLAARVNITRRAGTWRDDVFLFTMQPVPERLREGDLITFQARPLGPMEFKDETGAIREIPNVELLGIVEIREAD